MLEKMSGFFEARLKGYDEHMLSNIKSANEFYPFTVAQLPITKNSKILDLGCGTGLELGEYFKLNPDAIITGIDLSKGMLDELKRKFKYKNITLIQGSYFDVPFGESAFDAAVSVESLHHFTMNEKVPLYKKLYNSLKVNGYFILTDYFSLSNEEEQEHLNDFIKLKLKQGIFDKELYHYDTPLTVEHEIEALEKAGFNAKILNSWGATFTLKATK